MSCTSTARDGGAPDTALREALARDFGSLDRWRTEFVAMGKAMAAALAGCFSRTLIATGGS